MDILERIDTYMNERDEADEAIIEIFESLDESRKSQFVAKLIGLGVLVKGDDGKLKAGKNSMSKEEVIKKLGSYKTLKKIKKKVKKTLKDIF
jgi:uncharacterized coiled-coil DUF342 family protein